jgi:hypothetical protein
VVATAVGAIGLGVELSSSSKDAAPVAIVPYGDEHGGGLVLRGALF